jgi:hypothetical protein
MSEIQLALVDARDAIERRLHGLRMELPEGEPMNVEQTQLYATLQALGSALRISFNGEGI